MSHQRKVSDRQVAEMRNRRAAGEGVRALARYYDCAPAHVSRIVRGLSRGPTLRQQVATLEKQLAEARSYIVDLSREMAR